MAQVMENRSVLRGRVEQSERTGDAASVTLRVEAADPVPGYANLLERTLGTSITVTLPPGASPPPGPGEHLQFVVRATGPERYLALPESIRTE